VCDEQVAFVGGFNISPECEGDGVTSGWCDLGMKVEGPMAARLAETFHEVFERADAPHRPFQRLRKNIARKTVLAPHEQLLLSGLGRGRSPIKRALREDLRRAKKVQIMMGYFLPTWRLRRELIDVARRGGKVQLILAGKSDVLLSRLAAQSLYRRFLNAGVEIYEYQPQILHAKLIIIDDLVYVGSANLDQRSLNLNYELLLRLQNPEVATRAGEVFANNLAHSRQITREAWRRARTLWARFKQHWAYFLLVHTDPYIARQRWGKLAP
jgi:cardiolipin synthase